MAIKVLALFWTLRRDVDINRPLPFVIHALFVPDTSLPTPIRHFLLADPFLRP